MANKVATFLMFEGDAEEAMNFYVSLFEDAEAGPIVRFGPEGPGAEGSVMRANFRLCGQEFMCFDSPATHDFSFTPAISVFVQCEDEAELERAFEQLAAGGEVLMPLDEYGFSTRFGWINDRFGVSWQLSLA